ncbi:hypothetical protein Afil01_31730 [Actinorhabdospora filicis]|uniref:PemK-like, MazF-like toxin of type II toxin-antitoxin system n=1 Tax=Actinorhabdospora filicis TaxID=1785913 RepID=A0A9W6WA95_9ACTN|nr:type II toxin-antitoxin system PemK/MazF family toxin [Actinorhabdospora filicis]GLZ78366.1 hypothetical protein Afil01_31730 [Actinorhabdospora filicis]
MDESAPTSWICLAVQFGAIAISVAVAWLRRAPHRQVLLPHPPDLTWYAHPAPGEIWWARVGFRNSTGYKDRPCLIIRTHADHVVALPMTSRDRRHDRGYQEVYRTQDWDPRARGNSFVNLREYVVLTPGGLLKCAGMCSRRTWAVVQSRHPTGWIIEEPRLRLWPGRSPFKS